MGNAPLRILRKGRNVKISDSERGNIYIIN